MGIYNLHHALEHLIVAGAEQQGVDAWFFAVNGIHRFYLGKIGTGILMLLTLGGLWIWTIIDFIYAVSGNMKDKDGKLIQDWQA